ncbi:MAG: alcohol dehydrogenase catalytic domain-containing protein [Armatimonadetes bacterium]|nr:alcohol dehydrogenase catalytic domain-containing protein [Armatimonadota bacterium]
MLQAQLLAPRELVLREVPIPDPAPGEVLVKVEVALTCGTDLKTYRRGHAKLPFGPFGHEGAGKVVAVGEGVSHLQVGQKVTWMPTAPCGACEMCQRGHPNLCRNLFESVVLGAYAEYLLINARVARVHVFPLEGVSALRGAFAEPLACVIHAWRLLEPIGGRRVAIFGAGTMGYLHLMEAQARGYEVVMVGRRPEKLRLAQELGAQTWVLEDPEEVPSERFDAVIEATGARAMWELAPRWCMPGGKVLFYSGLAKDETVCLPAEPLHYDELTLLGSFHLTTEDAVQALERLKAGGLPVERLISETYPLRAIKQVFERLDRGEGMKYAIVP